MWLVVWRENSVLVVLDTTGVAKPHPCLWPFGVMPWSWQTAPWVGEVGQVEMAQRWSPPSQRLDDKGPSDWHVRYTPTLPRSSGELFILLADF